MPALYKLLIRSKRNSVSINSGRANRACTAERHGNIHVDSTATFAAWTLS